jgi:hypothetical protein
VRACLTDHGDLDDEEPAPAIFVVDGISVVCVAAGIAEEAVFVFAVREVKVVEDEEDGDAPGGGGGGGGCAGGGGGNDSPERGTTRQRARQPSYGENGRRRARSEGGQGLETER